MTGRRDRAMLLILGPLVCAAAADGPFAMVLTDDLGLIDEHQWTVAASRRRQTVATAPAAVVLIDEDSLRRSPGATLVDHLRYIPGVDVYQTRHGQYEVGLGGWNGQANTRTLVVADGRSRMQDELGLVLWPIAGWTTAMDHAEVVKGPAAASYGANAFGGVISLHHRPTDRQQWRAAVWGGQGSHGFQELEISLGGPTLAGQGWSSWAEARAGRVARDDLPGIRGATEDPDAPNTGRTGDQDFEAVRGYLAAGLAIDAGPTIVLDYERSDLREWDMMENLSPGSNRVNIDEHRFGGRLTWGLITFDHLHLRTDALYQNQIATFNPAAAYRYVQVGLDGVSDTTRVQFDVNLGQHHLTFGGERKRWESESNVWAIGGDIDDRSSWGRVSSDNHALFVDGSWRIASGWTLSTALRLDDHSDFGANLSPRLALNREFTDDSWWRITVSSGYRLPNPLETYIQEYYIRPDDDLGEERVSTIDGGLHWRENAWTVRVGTAFSRANDLLFYLPLPADEMAANFATWGGDVSRQPGPFFKIGNLDNPVHLLHGELEVRWKPSEVFEAFAGLTLIHYRHQDPIKLQSDGFAVPPSLGGTWFQFDWELPDDVNGPPPWKFVLGANLSDGGWFAGGALRAVAGRSVWSFPDTWFLEGTVLPTPVEPLAVQELDPYVALDLSAGYRFGGGEHAGGLRLAVMDVFDAGSAQAYQTERESLVAQNESQAAARIGRQITLTLDLRF